MPGPRARAGAGYRSQIHSLTREDISIDPLPRPVTCTIVIDP